MGVWSKRSVCDWLVLICCAIWSPVALGGKPKKATPCPKGCFCEDSGQRNIQDCTVSVTCESKRAKFPTADEYPPELDCLFLNSPKLSKATDEEKEQGLRAIPESVRRLDLSQAGLSELPGGDVIGRLSELRVLNLEFNKLKRLPPKIFHGLTKLKVLWLTGNHYQKGEPEYKKMKALGNHLEALDSKQFQGLEGLQVLLMHHNKLTELPEGLFEDQKKLKVLKLLDNKFKPKLTRKHPAFAPLLNDPEPATYQLDISQDSGDELEDYWEKTGTYLGDDFFKGKVPKKKKKKKKKSDEL